MLPNVEIMLARDNAKPPKYMTEGAAGADIFASTEEAITIKPGTGAIVKSGFHIGLPPAYEAQIRSRSGLAAKNSVFVINAPGTIDCDYKKEVGVILFNSGTEDFVVNDGDRIAQMVIAEAPQFKFDFVSYLDDEGRGGFGSTGVSG